MARRSIYGVRTAIGALGQLKSRAAGVLASQHALHVVITILAMFHRVRFRGVRGRLYPHRATIRDTFRIV